MQRRDASFAGPVPRAPAGQPPCRTAGTRGNRIAHKQMAERPPPVARAALQRSAVGRDAGCNGTMRDAPSLAGRGGSDVPG